MSRNRKSGISSAPKRDLHQSFNRRSAWMMLGGGLAFTGVAVRMAALQTENAASNRYSAERDENRFDMRIVAPPRGILYDRFGVQLATTAVDYRVSLVPERAAAAITEATGQRLNAETREAAVASVVMDIAAILGLDDTWVASRMRDARQGRRFDAILLRRGLTWEQFNAINVRLPELPGINAETGQTRRYPFDVVYGHPIGYVQRPNQTDVERLRDEGRTSAYFQHPDTRVGKSGMEFALEQELDGIPGYRRVVVNARGRVISETGGQDKAPIQGQDVIMTLDHELQKFAMERMAGESAAAVLIDVLDGDIYTLASAPGFDPNAFVDGIGRTAFQALNAPEAVGPTGEMRNLNRLFHKCVTGAYKPGSTFKMVTGLAALSSGLPENFRVTCPGYFPFGGRAFHCWKRGGHGTVDLHTAIKSSCNVFFYNAALRAGIDSVAAMARTFGLGQAFDIDVPGVEDGIVPDPAWWGRVRGGPWPPGNTLNVGIGQGDIQASPLQLAVMAARMANGGLNVMPRLVREMSGRAPPAPPQSLRINPQHLDMIRSGMFGVCNEGGGTAFRAGQLGLVRHPDTGEIVEASEFTRGFPPIQIAGKTGTAQVRIITAAERSRGVRRNQDLEWRLRDHALFVCFGPFDQPRYACAVIVEHGGGGSVVAAPIASDLMRKALLRDPAKRRAQSLVDLAAKPGSQPA
ncbi:MAG: penicillin-binding protein 2 [Caulobacterales bacterium]|jgi:penicillin-binding protein 2